MSLDNFIKYDITEVMADEADRRAERVSALRGSIMGYPAKIQGCLGELLIELWLKSENIDFTPQLTETTHDYIVEGAKVDVKTKNRTVPPAPNFECTVYDYNYDHQVVDYYLFVSLQRKKGDERYKTTAIGYHTGYILGACTRQMYEKHGVHWKKGQTDPTNGQVVKKDSTNIFISQLIPPK